MLTQSSRFVSLGGSLWMEHSPLINLWWRQVSASMLDQTVSNVPLLHHTSHPILQPNIFQKYTGLRNSSIGLSWVSHYNCRDSSEGTVGRYTLTVFELNSVSGTIQYNTKHISSLAIMWKLTYLYLCTS